MLRTPQDARQMLERLGAPKRLILHLDLVGEAAKELLQRLKRFEIDIDEDLVRLGVAVHDAGKIVHPEELSGPGSQHESAGEHLLLDAGVQPAVARCCVSHAQYATLPVSLEELLVALSDKLWKGKREGPLEAAVVERVAQLAGMETWSVFSELDEQFEEIAARGDDRLARSASVP